MSAAQPAELATPVEAESRRAKPKRGLLGKYTVTLVALVLVVLAVNSSVEAWIAYGDTMDNVRKAQSEKIRAVAKAIDSELDTIERQVSWATRASSSTLDKRRADYTLLLTEVPALDELAYVDGTGNVELDVARLGAPVTFERADRGTLDALNHPVWYGPTSFIGSDPFFVLGLSHSGANAGSTLARVRFKALAEILDATTAGGGGDLLLVDDTGRVLATSTGSRTRVGSLSRATSPEAVRDGPGGQEGVFGRDADGRPVIASQTALPRFGKTLVVEQPVLSALRPVVDLSIRQAWLMVLGLAVAVLAGSILARRMTRPIQALQAAAAQFAAHRFDHRIAIRTGDEVEDLAGQLNRMADELAASYGQLEHKVEQRTRALERSMHEVEALEEMGRAMAASLDIRTVLDVIVTRAIDLTQADAAAVFIHDAAARVLVLTRSCRLPERFTQAAGTTTLRVEAGWAQAEFGTGGIVDIADLEQVTRFPLRQATLDAGFRSVLATALRGSQGNVGVLVLYRQGIARSALASARVMKTLADQSVLAINNARLFQEVANKSAEIEVANAHRAMFFANMSHELRTPLNAVLGYAELLNDGIYGALPERALDVLERVQANGKHLLSLINDVLDLTKMEAGSLHLTLTSYSLDDVVSTVFAAAEPLAAAKNLALRSAVPPGLPVAQGDDRRLTQVLLNVVGNAIKFTDEGSVTIEASASGAKFHIVVRDTGPGIPPEDLQRIFDEFQQVESADGRKTTGTGLGLAIARRLLAMHGGTITVESKKGQGSTFSMELPIRVDIEASAA